jgi:translation elongation factor EF-G
MDFKKLEEEITKEFGKFLSDMNIPISTTHINSSPNKVNIKYENNAIDWNSIKKKYKIKDTKELKEHYNKALQIENLFFNKFATFDIDF